jgi:hypothetical protein
VVIYCSTSFVLEFRCTPTTMEDVNERTKIGEGIGIAPAAAISPRRLCEPPVISLDFAISYPEFTRHWLQDRNTRKSFKAKLGREFYPSITRAVLRTASLAVHHFQTTPQALGVSCTKP